MGHLTKGRGRKIIDDDDSDPQFVLETFNKEPLTIGGTPLNQTKLGWTMPKPEKTINGHQVWWRLKEAEDWDKCRSLDFFHHKDLVLKVGHDVEVCRNDEALQGESVAHYQEDISFARILEIRRVNSTKCWLRVFWWYWPQSLPNGREKWHGHDELVATTDMAIIDSGSVMSVTSVVRMQENGDVALEIPHYWRQQYDYYTGKLSSLNTICFCRQIQNPDDIISQCEFCNLWHHEHCLKEAACRYHWVSMGNNFEFPKKDQVKISTSKEPAMEPKFPWTGILKAELEYKEKELTYYAWVSTVGRTNSRPIKVPVLCTYCSKHLAESKDPKEGSTAPTSKGLAIREKTRTPPPTTPTFSDELSEIMSPKRKRTVKSKSQTKKLPSTPQEIPYTPLTPKDSVFATPEPRSPKSMSSEDEIVTSHPPRKMSKPDVRPLSRAEALNLQTPKRRGHASLSIEPQTPTRDGNRRALLTEMEREALPPHSAGNKSSAD